MGNIYVTNALELIGAITDNCNPDPEQENKKYYRCSVCIPNYVDRNGEHTETTLCKPSNHKKLIRNPNSTPSVSQKNMKPIPPAINIEDPFNWNESESNSLDRIIGNIEPPGHFGSNNSSNISSLNNSSNNSSNNSPIYIDNNSSLCTVDINTSSANSSGSIIDIDEEDMDNHSSDSKEDDYKLQIQQDIIQNNLLYASSADYIQQINGNQTVSNCDININNNNNHNKIQRKNYSLTDIDNLPFHDEDATSDTELVLNLGIKLKDRSGLTHNIYLKKRRLKNKLKRNRRVNSMF